MVNKKIKLFEFFAGMGAQQRGFENILINNKNFALENVGICEWTVSAIIAYDTLHNGLLSNFSEYESLDESSREAMIEYLSNFTLSLNGKTPMNKNRLNTNHWNLEQIRQLYIAMKRTKNVGSIVDVNFEDLPHDATAWFYSFPCQNVSSAGNGEGIVEGTSSGLLWEFERILKEAEASNSLPPYLIMENVKALFNRTHKPSWDRFASFLESLGYKNSEMVLNAQDFSTAQHRERVFCISELNGKKAIEVKGTHSHPSLHDFLDLDNDDLIEEYKEAMPDNTPSRIGYIEKTKKLNDQNYCQTIMTKVDGTPSAGLFWCDENGKLIDNENRDWNINGSKSPFRFLTEREAIKLMGFTDNDYEKLIEANISKLNIQKLAGNSIVVPKLEAIFSAIIKRISIKERIKKTVATKTKKMKAKVLRAIEQLNIDNKKVNPHSISKKANIHYATARKYYKIISSYHVATWSGGKDSTYMILELLRKKEPLDEIIFSDTGYEFPQMYDYIEKVEKYINEKYPHVKITKLNYQSSTIWKEWAETSFTRGENEGSTRGFPYWIGMSWCTRELKVIPIDKYLKENVQADIICKYVGIAADEPKRVKDSGELYPLVRWKITEKQIIKKLKKMGFHNPLYNDFQRTGCYLCPKQGMKSLQTLYFNYPALWNHIVELEQRYKEQGSNLWKFKGIGTEQLAVNFTSGFSNNLEEEIGCLCK